MNTPSDRTYLQSYLNQAGVRFDFNLVDTVCNRKLSVTFYLAVIAALLVFGLPLGMPGNQVTDFDAATQGIQEVGSGQKLFFYCILALLLVYIVSYLLRLSYFMSLRAKLRKDPAPIAVEAYAVVCLDVRRKFSDQVIAYLGQWLRHDPTAFCKYAVIYKELGTTQPRFFLSAAVSTRKLCFIPEHIGRVFIHRTKANLYTLDDKSGYQTASERQPVFGNFAVGSDNLSASQAAKINAKSKSPD